MAGLKQTLNHKVVRPLEDPEAFEEYGIGVVNGVLLHGPPGCRKTYVAGARWPVRSTTPSSRCRPRT